MTNIGRFNLEALIEARMERFHFKIWNDKVEALADYIAETHEERPLNCNIDDLLINYLVVLCDEELDEHEELILDNVKNEFWKEIFVWHDQNGKCRERWFINELNYFPIPSEV